MKHFYIKIFSLIILLLVCISSIFSQTVTTTINYSGFQACGGCTVCGADYWCTNTPGSYCGNTAACIVKTFFDPVPAGNVITNVTVNYFTASCNGAAIYGTFGNGSSNIFVLPTAYDGSSGCLCSNSPCMLTTSASSSFPCGIPGYTYGGWNTFNLCSNGPMCINRAEIVFTYVNPNTITPTITPSGPTSLCAGGSVTLTANSGFTYYTWSTGAHTQSITVSTAGTYTVTVTSTTGCTTGSASIIVVVNPNPTVTASATSPSICNGLCTNLNAGGASTYTWMPGSLSGSTVNVCPTSTTTYTVTGTSAIGCTNTATVTVTVLPMPTVTANATTPTLCNGQCTNLNAGGASTYTWMPGSLSGATVNVCPVSTTTYTVTGTSGCTNTATVTVTVNPKPTVTANATSPTICNGQCTNLNASGASTYTWMPGSLSGTTVSVCPISTTTYTVTGTAANGCTNTAAVTVTVNPQPTVTASAVPPAICNGLCTNLTAGGASTYTWMPGSLSGPTVNVCPSVATTYTVTGTAANGCSNTATVTVNISTNPTVTANATTPTICNGQCTNLNAGGALTYTWMPGSLSGATVNVCPTSTTTYTVTGTNVAGCSNTAVVTVTVNPAPIVTANATTPSICVGQCTNLNAGGASTYTWMPGSLSGATVNVCPGATTTYTVTGTSALGCTNTAIVTVTVISNPTVTANATTPTICNGQCTNLNAGGASTYAWMPGNLSGATVNVCPGTTTTYTVTGTSAAGCTNSATVTVTVISNPIVTANATTPTICNGQCTNINAGGASTYVWMPGSLSGATVNVCPTSTTTYTVTGTSAGGCSATATVTVTVNPLPTVTASASPNPICVNDFTTITAAGASNYSWSHGLGTGNPKTVSPATTTTYTITGTGANGCTNTTTVTVTVNPLPVVTSNATFPTICNGQCTNLNAGGANTYTWMPGSLSGATVNVCPTSTTTYTVTGTSNDGCTATSSVTVTVNPNPVVTATAVSPGLCADQCTNINAGGATTYSWMPGNLSGATINVCPVITTTYTVTGTIGTGCSSSASVTVTMNPSPTANAGTDVNIGVCSSASNPVLNGSGTGTAPLSFSWSPSTGLSDPNIATPIADPASTTTYTLTVTNGFGCTASDDIVVTVAPLPTANAGSDQNIGACSWATNASLSGSGTGTPALSYSWLPTTGLSNPNISNPVADPATTTTYTLTVTDFYGCTATDAVMITVDPLPTVNAGTDQNIGACASAANANINAAATGIAPLTYSWTPTTGLSNPNISNPVADPAVSTTYTVTVSDAYGCIATDDILITVQPLPTANAGTDQNLGACNSSANANLTGVGTGIAPLTYAWLPIAGLSNPNIYNPIADPASTTIYTLTVTDVYGCTATDDITITVDPLPTANAGTDMNIGACGFATNANIIGSGTGTGPLAYSWLPTAGLSDPSISNPIANPVSTTTYTLTVTDLYGCTATDDITINVEPLPTASAGVDQTIGACSNAANASINGTGTGIQPLSYSWLPVTGLSNPGISNPVADPPSTTTYTMTVTDVYGCTATDDITITVAPLPTIIAGTDQNIGACLSAANANINSLGTGTAPLIYSWSPVTGLNNPNISNPVADPATTTNYIVTLTDAFGCSVTDDINIFVDPLPTSNAGSDQSIGACNNSPDANLNGSGTGINPLSYTWAPITGVNDPNIAITTAHPFNTTIYTLIVTDTYGCTATDDVIISVSPAPAANAGPDASIGTCSWSMANLDGSATGATPFGYSWTPIQGLTNSYIPNPQAHPPMTTIYTLTVTDIYDCTAQDFVTVTVNPLPNVSVLANPSTICETFASSINAFGALTYTWSPGTGLSSTTGQAVTASPLTTTIYTVTGSDQFTCTASAQTTITVNPNPVLTITPSSPAICFGDNVTITAVGADSYTWLPTLGLSSSTSDIVVATPGSTIIYTVTGTTLGCTGTASVTVTVNPLPVIIYTPFNEICLNDTPFALTQGSPAGGYYTGDGITGTDNFNPSVAGVGTHLITYTYTDINNCVNSATQNITVKPNPILVVTPTLISICLGTSTFIQASGADSYLWSPDNTLSSSTGSSVTATPTTSTTYTLVGTIDGCTDSENITVNTFTTIPVIVTPPTDSLCPGGSTVINASGGFNYTWLPIDGLSNYSTSTVVCTPSASTVYTVYASDNDGCTGTATATVIIYPEAFLHFTTTPKEGCTPLYVEFNYIPDGTLDTNTLNYDFGDLLSTTDYSNQPNCSYTYNDHGNFFIMLTGMSEHGCHAIGYDTVLAFKSPEAGFYPNPEVGETDNPVIEFYDQSYYTTHWLWNFGDPPTDENNTSELQNPIHIYSDSGNFIVMLIASNEYNCRDTAVRVIKINESFVFYVPNAFTPNDNGMNDGFIGKGVGFREDDFEMYIYDRWGRNLFFTKDCNKPWDGYNAKTNTYCTEGIYVWLINITERSGIKHTLKGTVTIVR